MNTRIDVLCVGLGPAGARAACAAASQGLRVLGVDRKHRAGTPVQCAEFVPALLGVDMPDLRAYTEQRIAAMETYVEGTAPYRVEPFLGCMIDRADFDMRLVADAIYAGADCRFGVNVREIGIDGRVTLSDGATVLPRLIVGADGPRSLVGRAIGSVNTALVETRQITVPLRQPHDATDIFLSTELPGGYAWLFPKARVANLGAGADPARQGDLKRILHSLHARLIAEGRVGPAVMCSTGGAIPVGGPLTPRGRLGLTAVLLAGDAAGLANPITGAGIAAAVQSGTIAGEHAVRWLAGRAAALNEYEEEIDALFGPSLRRALERRVERMHARPTPAALRRSWIAFPEYWTEGAPA